MDYIQYIAAAFGIGGALLISFKRIKGFYLYMVANTLWIIFGISTNQLGIVLQFVVFWILALIGLIYWKKTKKII